MDIIKTTGKYILDENKNVVEETDLIKWAIWMEERGNMVIKQEELPDDIRVSTVFLGIDCSWGKGMSPRFFETMIFGGDRDEERTRTETYKEAIATHQRIVASLFEV